jgi:hypothetical protein
MIFLQGWWFRVVVMAVRGEPAFRFASFDVVRGNLVVGRAGPTPS